MVDEQHPVVHDVASQTQLPLDVSQSCPMAHVFAVPLWQAPAWQVSSSVHALLSLQPTPSAWFGLEHAPVAGLQAPI
jgi:hypothetical protein